MFEPIGPTRPLPYPLKEQISNGNVTDDLGLTPNDFIWPEDPEERVIVPFLFSQREFTAIASCVDVGADIAYPQQYIEVVWLLMRSLRYKVDLCQLIADCINDPESPARDAIRDFIQADNELRSWRDAVTSIVPSGQLGQNLGDVTDCDPDLLFNVCTVAVDLLNSISEDIFSIIELGTNAFERGDALFSAIPVVGAVLPVDEIMSLAEQLVSGFEEAYLAAYTETLEDELRCGLFCMAKPDCQLTIADMIGWYEAALSHSLPQDPLEAIADIFNFILTSEFSGDTVVYAAHLMVLASMRSGDGILGFQFSQLAMRLIAAQDESNNDWEELCEDCDTPDIWYIANAQFPTHVGGLGDIVEQTSNSITVNATQSPTDNQWRIAIRTDTGCKTLLTWSGTIAPIVGSSYAKRCGMGALIFAQPAVGNTLDNIVANKNTAGFTISFTW